MYRSIMESIAMTMNISVENMIREMGRKPKILIISGGGSNSNLFMQIFADVFWNEDSEKCRQQHGRNGRSH